MKTVAVAVLMLVSMPLSLTAFAQTESKTFAKVMSRSDSLTVKANRTPRKSPASKAGGEQLEMVIFRPYQATDEASDEHYSATELAALQKALASLTDLYKQWKGKRLGTQSHDIGIRSPDTPAAGRPITISLQMDEMGHISIYLQQGPVGFEADVKNLPKLRETVNNAAAWIAQPAGVAQKAK